ncbi:hypothetical protein Pfo_008007 [Paulownia fortunei]|nr:hypothetical protein Pfo_008007 [Paulownia fortunei]
METYKSPNPFKKSAQKFVKSIPQSAVSSANRGLMRNKNTKPLEFRLDTEQRTAQRAIFNSSVAIKQRITEQHKKQVEKVLKIIEEEEVRMLRKEMIPRAQLMPIFDRPFLPQRSSRPLTIPREPNFHLTDSKHFNSISCG